MDILNAPVGTYELGPLEVLDFGINWGAPASAQLRGPWLQFGETIIGTPVITQDGGDDLLTINPVGTATMVNRGLVSFWCSTPTVNVSYNVHVTITTSLGRTSTRRIVIVGVAR